MEKLDKIRKAMENYKRCISMNYENIDMLNIKAHFALGEIYAILGPKEKVVKNE